MTSDKVTTPFIPVRCPERSEDGSGFYIGQKVVVDDLHSEFEGVYLGLTGTGLARVRDTDSGEILVGSIDFVSPAEQSQQSGS